jgi:VWFA-related protein
VRNLLAALFAGVLWMSIAAHSFQEPIDPGSQLPPPTFRTSVNGVVLDLRVVDRNGHFVEDLSREDFRVYEDGREEAVSTFELVDIPRAVPERPTFAGMPISSDVASNEHSEGRLYILLLDDRDVRALRSVTVRALAEEFVEQDVGPRDLVALATTSSRREMTVEFTNDKRRLLDAIDRFQGGFGTGNPLSEVRAVANMLPADGRRKTVVLISEGLPSGLPNLPNALSSGVGDRRSIFEMFSKRDRAVLDLRDVIEAAARNNVNIYAIDPMGHPGAPASGVKPLPYLIGESSLRTTRQDALTTVANETGGESLIGSNDFSNAFDRIVEESSHYYTLGYVSRNNARDGKFRQVSVQVDRPGVSVRTRTDPRGLVARDGHRDPESYADGRTEHDCGGRAFS